MPNDIDIGAAFGILWILFWGAFAFVVFIIVVSTLQALLDHYVKIPKNKKDEEKEE